MAGFLLMDGRFCLQGDWERGRWICGFAFGGDWDGDEGVLLSGRQREKRPAF